MIATRNDETAMHYLRTIFTDKLITVNAFGSFSESRNASYARMQFTAV